MNYEEKSMLAAVEHGFLPSGKYIYRCEVKSDLILAMQKIPNNIPVQIQEEVKAERFITLQYRVTETDVIRLIAAEFFMVWLENQRSDRVIILYIFRLNK